MTEPRSIFADLPADLPAEWTQTLLAADEVRIERIVSFGQASPAGFWYDQEEHEWVLLLAGAAGLRFELDTAPVILKPGSFIHIPAHVRHRVEWTEPDQRTVWLAVFHREWLAPASPQGRAPLVRP